MSSVEQHDVVVIGAGPAGLSLGYFLEKAGLDYLLLEKERVGYSWSTMPEKLVVLSPWWVNTLPGSWIGWRNPFRLVGKDFYTAYLERYAENNHIKIRDKTAVSTVESTASGFEIQLGEKSLQARIVVCATGYYSNPMLPTLEDGNDNSITEMHAVNYYSASKLIEEFPGVKNILLVGKRVTAGQLLVEISDAGLDIDICCRSELEFRDNYTLKGITREYLYYFYEAVQVLFNPNLRYDSFPSMDGGATEELINGGKVGKKSAIQAIKDGNVVFANGEMKNYDLVIYATGYNPTIGYLADSLVQTNEKHVPETSDMESKLCDNLFFLGLDNLVNFRSRYLRGIASDARLLSRIIQARLGSMQ